MHSRMAGNKFNQNVSDETYEKLISKKKTYLRVQKNKYITSKLKGKKYILIGNDEKPRTRFRIESVKEKTGSIVEDIYGTMVTGPYLAIELKLRKKTP